MWMFLALTFCGWGQISDPILYTGLPWNVTNLVAIIRAFGEDKKKETSAAK